MRTRPENLSGFSLFVLKHDDERFKLKAGDILLGQPYLYDRDKTSIAFRISDGYRPECNQYNSSIRLLTAVEVERVVWGGELGQRPSTEGSSGTERRE